MVKKLIIVAVCGGLAFLALRGTKMYSYARQGIQEAGDAVRWRHEGSSTYNLPKMTDGGYVQVESGVPYETVRALGNRGHLVRAGDGSFGGYQAIRWDPVNKVYWGASESRKDGCAMGY